MVIQIIEKLKNTFKNFDKKIIKILQFGFHFCMIVAIISAIILVTYLFFLHSTFLYEIGLTVFQLSLCFTAEFIASAITVDTISKQI